MKPSHSVLIGSVIGYALGLATSAFLPEFLSIAFPIVGGSIAYLKKPTLKTKKQSIETPNESALPSFKQETLQRYEALKDKVSVLNSDFLKKTEDIGDLLDKMIDFVDTTGSLRLQFQVKNGLNELILIVDNFLAIEDPQVKLQTWRSVLKQGFNPYIEKLRYINDHKNTQNLQALMAQLEQASTI